MVFKDRPRGVESQYISSVFLSTLFSSTCCLISQFFHHMKMYIIISKYNIINKYKNNGVKLSEGVDKV